MNQHVKTRNFSNLEGQSVHNTTPQGMTYQEQLKGINLMSYSTQLELHKCPRKFQLTKLAASTYTNFTDNIHFMFGHSVGAGIQNFALTADLDSAIWDAFISWNGDLLLAEPLKGKSISHAIAAVMKFAEIWPVLAGSWVVATMPNDKPAIEVSFALDCEDGNFYLGHIDVVLWNPNTKEFKILEIKTTGATYINEAQYKNSAQALGYGLIIDNIARQMGLKVFDYTVIYLVYKCKSGEYEVMQFTKSKRGRAAWLLQLKMDFALISYYQQSSYFPLHGESCYDMMSPCRHFGTCDIADTSKEFITRSRDELEGIEWILNISELEV